MRILLIVLLFIPISLAKEITITHEAQDVDNSYSKVIEFIKSQEGFRSNPYYCAGHKLTVGYGHQIKSRDSFVYPISRELADTILFKDFNNSIILAKRYTDWHNDSLLAISHFIFAFGETKFRKSTLYSLIKEDKCIISELRKWIHVNGVPNKHIRKNREFEIKLLTNGTN